ncbi:regulator of G-protein signaling 17 isoform X2 [Phymastichus coffea]|uniref:regulator of G-protein signaling 17 isoform X2 n=1 Tax=Phymastichus coffea TaxID=108790 RepID=UPI00273C904E|nr:regulator of G-protein signaling 17 isoform X2 [Phymastichus coffea]
MIEMSSGIGATAMGLGVSHGGNSGGNTAGDSSAGGGGCRLRAQSQSQVSQSGSPSSSIQQQQPRGSNNSGQPTTKQRSNDSQRHGIMGRPRKDNCCLCWCCCCSCSLAAVGTGSGGGGGGMRSSGGLMSGDHGNDLTAELSAAAAGNGLEGDINDITIDEIRSWGSSFDRLMRNPVGRKLFKEFLVSEYSDENIAFWLACEQLKRESNPERIEEKARYIYEDYISIISPKEVSLDSRVREIVNRNMTRPTPHTFDEAQLQIYTLMHRDSYPRFVNSELYQRVARMNSGPPSPCIDDNGGSGGGGGGGNGGGGGGSNKDLSVTSAPSSSQTRKSKKSIT